MEKLTVYAQEDETKIILGIRVISNLAVTVSTKDTVLAGTDAHVFPNLGSLGTYPFVTIGQDDFEKGDTRTYWLDSNFTLAALLSERIELGHDNTGKMPGWNVSGVAIQIKLASSNMLSLYKKWGEIGWLSATKEPYFTTIAELQDGSS
ncbi:MAG: PLAT/LH2 domain-containing protein [Roseobacter sp.]